MINLAEVMDEDEKKRGGDPGVLYHRFIYKAEALCYSRRRKGHALKGENHAFLCVCFVP